MKLARCLSTLDRLGIPYVETTVKGLNNPLDHRHFETDWNGRWMKFSTYRGTLTYIQTASDASIDHSGDWGWTYRRNFKSALKYLMEDE